jgi:hypothetical protein
VLLHAEVRLWFAFLALFLAFFLLASLLFLQGFLFLPLFLDIAYSHLLRACAYTVWRIAYDGIEKWPAILGDTWVRTVHHEDLGDRHLVVVEICENVVARNLVQPFHLVFGLPTHSVAFEDPDVKVTAIAESIEVLTSRHYAACASEGVIYKVPWRYLALVGHQEG